ncbi:hypothetical protein, partial [Pyrobaculum sp.]|uniref:hypothetical protein n=1 Tax=Pyrobaculum sp. TaxID=2004705 RepID=UPI003D1133DD
MQELDHQHCFCPLLQLFFVHCGQELPYRLGAVRLQLLCGSQQHVQHGGDVSLDPAFLGHSPTLGPSRKDISSPCNEHVLEFLFADTNMFKIDFGKLGRPYDAMRRELAEGFTVEVDGKKIPGTCKRWYT